MPVRRWNMNTQETYDDVLARAERLSFEDIKRLVDDLKAKLEQHSEEEPKPLYDVLDFEGIGSETWKNVDIDEYIKQERASWNG